MNGHQGENVGLRNLNLRVISAAIIVLLTLVVYGWTISEPLAGDALMHVMDSNQIRGVGDVFSRLFGLTRPAHGSEYRLEIFHRPVFNDLYISILKYLFGVSPIGYRISTLVLQCVAGLLIFNLFLHLSNSVLASWLGAIALLFAPALFFGLYEFGISFSQVLTCGAVASLFFANKYSLSNKALAAFSFGFLTFIATFMVVFTKESALLWPLVVIVFIFCSQINPIFCSNN